MRFISINTVLYPTIPYNTLQYLQYLNYHNTVVNRIQRIYGAIDDLYQKITRFSKLKLFFSIRSIRLSTVVVTNIVIRAQGCGKRSEIVDLQLTNQIPDLLYPTIPSLP